jgi:hypothetical protein
MIQLIYLFLAAIVAILGYHIHGSVFFGFIDFLFWPLALMKWLIYKQISLSVIKSTFTWFFK